MKKTTEVLIHLLFWIFFAAVTVIQSKLYLEAKPEAAFGNQFFYVNFLEVIMGVIFFYTIYFGLTWGRKKTGNMAILVIAILFLLLLFAFPATKFGLLQVMSSVIPHLFLVFLGVIFRLASGSIENKNN